MDKQTRDQIVHIMTSVKNGIIYFQRTKKYKIIEKCLAALKSIELLCQQGFSPERSKQYLHALEIIIDKLNAKETSTTDNCQLLLNAIDSIIKRLENDKEVKKEILFLPYKASMWDSLESIWQAADEDKEHCQAFVVPIPYCDRNPDGTASTWHCEKDEFPDYVPTIDFNEYDIAKRRPDIIYIHNPYDEYNRVTSVDSRYYSHELKKYTKMLVYVPYFVMGDTIDESFCQASAVVNADKVIVQSEEIKRQYEAYYPGGNPPENKFLPLGSPKFDKVLSSKKEDFVLPDSWKKIIKGKKVILYNTSLSAMLENSDKVNEKLRYVFSVFKNRKDVALWWRPHPLMKSSMASMRPNILKEYESIETEYKQAGWGIYDDTVELHRAIAWSDAYYGDISSVVWLYRNLLKPIMIECIIDRNVPFSFGHCEIIDSKVYFVPIIFGLLFMFDLEKNLLTFIKIDGQFNSNLQVFGGVIYKNEELFLYPHRKDTFIKYNIITKKQHQMNALEIDNNINETDLKYESAVRCKKIILFYGHTCPSLIKYDFATRKYTSIDNYRLYIKKIIKGYFLISDTVVVDNILYMVMDNTNIILKVNIDTFDVEHYVLGKEMRNVGIIFDGVNFWITSSFNTNIYCYDKKFNYIDKFDCPYISNGKNPFLKIKYFKNKIYLFGNKNKEEMFIISFSLNEKKFFMIKSDLGYLIGADIDIEKNEAYLQYILNNKSCFKKVNLINFTENVYDFSLNEKISMEIFKYMDVNRKNAPYYENQGEFNIKTYIKFVLSKRDNDNKKVEKMMSGLKIYKNIMGNRG